jgi:hypothetical protein
MSKVQKSVVLYDGVKFFIRGKKRKEIPVMLVNNSDDMCLEVIAKFDTVIIRKYLDLKQLIPTVDLTVINEAFLAKQSYAEYQNKPFNGGRVMRDLAVEQMVSTIRDRIELSPTKNDIYFKSSPNDKIFTSTVQNDGSTIFTLTCELSDRPETVIPYDVSEHIRFQIK